MQPNKLKRKPEVLKRIADSRYLKRGDLLKIADICGVTKQAVNGYIRGYTNSPRIEIVFNEFVNQRKETIDRRLKQEFN